MKHTELLWLILIHLLIACDSTAQKAENEKLLLGAWKQVGIECDTFTLEQKNQMKFHLEHYPELLHFKKDSLVVSGPLYSTQFNTIWHLSNDGNYLNTNFQGINVTLNIEKLSKDSLIFFNSDNQIRTAWINKFDSSKLDKGLSILLPPKREDNALNEFKMKARNVFKVLVNAKNQLLVEEEPCKLMDIRPKLKAFITNNGKNEEMPNSPQEAVVSFKTDRGTQYAIYIKVLDEIKGAYHELRAEYLGITLKEYLRFDEKSAMEDPKLIEKVDMFNQLVDLNFSIREYLNFDVKQERKKGNISLIKAYESARESSELLFIEKRYDAMRKYPMRIVEAEPAKIGD